MESKEDIVSRLAQTYTTALFEDVIPFWQNHSCDYEFGGYFTSLDRKGAVYDTDKFVWLQARQVWMFSHLYRTVEANEQWLDMARLGADFLMRNGRAEDGSFYYALAREGRPLSLEWSIFSDGFAAMALAEYSRVANDSRAADIALQAYRNYVRRKASPKGRFAKAAPGARPLENLGLRMMHLNLLLVMGDMIDQEQTTRLANELIDDVLGIFRYDKLGILLENVPADGGISDTYEGRIVNPGHGLEVLWMALACALQWGRTQTIPLIVKTMISTAEYGWDWKYGGILYRLDVLGKPPLAIEWDRKLSWCIAEAIIAFSMAYQHTRSSESLTWLQRCHDYAWTKFADSQYGEWFGYLDRQGNVLLDIKGCRWKGCFHVPRMLLFASRALKAACAMESE